VSDTTASGLERLDGCPASGALPVRALTTGDAAERGNEIHGYLEIMLPTPPLMALEHALAKVPDEWRPACAGIDLAAQRAGLEEIQTEVAFLLDVETEAVTRLGAHLDRAYPDCGQWQVPGTIDLVGLRASGRLVVRDYKTGQRVTATRDNLQMLFAATVVSLYYDVSEVDAELTYVHEDGSTWTDLYTFTAMDLVGACDRIRGILLGVEDARAELAVAGALPVYPSEKRCKYCPAFISCPAQTALARSLLPDLTMLAGPNQPAKVKDLQPAVRAYFAELSDEDAGRAWEVRTKAKRLLEAIDEALKARARKQGIPLPSGKRVVALESKRKVASFDLAEKLLRTKGASEAEIAACHVEITVVSAREIRPKDEPDAEPAQGAA
jgi:hypothetical protein